MRVYLKKRKHLFFILPILLVAVVISPQLLENVSVFSFLPLLLFHRAANQRCVAMATGAAGTASRWLGSGDGCQARAESEGACTETELRRATWL